MEKEKKLKPIQKIALERIYRLFELSEKKFSEGKTNYSKRYLQLAKRISEKYTTQTPSELKQKYCKKCYSMNITQKKQSPFLITICKDCKYEKKYALETKKKE